jgi:hypothetical protein
MSAVPYDPTEFRGIVGRSDQDSGVSPPTDETKQVQDRLIAGTVLHRIGAAARPPISATRPYGNRHVGRPGAFSHGTPRDGIDAATPLLDHCQDADAAPT